MTDIAQSQPGIEFYDQAIESLNNGDSAVAIRLFKQAAKLGCLDAYYELGNIYYYGNDEVAENETTAQKYYLMGAQQGSLNCLEMMTSFYIRSEMYGEWLAAWQQIIHQVYAEIEAAETKDFSDFLRFGYLFAEQAVDNGVYLAVIDMFAAFTSMINVFTAYGEEKILSMKKRLNDDRFNQPFLDQLNDEFGMDEEEGLEMTLRTNQDMLDPMIARRRKIELAILLASMKIGPDEQPEPANQKWFNTLKSAQIALFGDEEGSIDIPRAIRLFKQAADLGCEHASIFLGMIYESGIGVESDENEAVRWYQKAGEQGSLNGMMVLADLYKKNEDYTNLFKVWYRVLNKLYADYQKDPAANKLMFVAVACTFVEAVIKANREKETREMINWLRPVKADILAHFRGVIRNLSEDYGGGVRFMLTGYLEKQAEIEKKMAVLLG